MDVLTTEVLLWHKKSLQGLKWAVSKYFVNPALSLLYHHLLQLWDVQFVPFTCRRHQPVPDAQFLWTPWVCRVMSLNAAPFNPEGGNEKVLIFAKPPENAKQYANPHKPPARSDAMGIELLCVKG